MRLENAEKMARMIVELQETYGEMLPSDGAIDLARALLAVMPVVRAAEHWRDDTYPQTRSWKAATEADGALVSAVDALRIKQTGRAISAATRGLEGE